MSRVCIVANLVTQINYNKGISYIGVDYGSIYCMHNQIPLHCAIGDFDSIDPTQLQELKLYTNVIQLPCEKDEVDTECAIRYASKRFEEIDVYGVTGGRLDHFMIIYQLLKKGDIDFRISDDQNIIYLLKPGVHKIKNSSKYISLYPLEKLILSIEGCKYNLDTVDVDEYSVHLSSNEIEEDEAIIKIDGRLIVMQTNEIKKDVNY